MLGSKDEWSDPKAGYSSHPTAKVSLHCHNLLVNVTYHDALWQICFRKDYSAEALQEIDEKCIRASRTERTADVAQGRIEPLHIELIFKRDRYAVKGTF